MTLKSKENPTQIMKVLHLGMTKKLVIQGIDINIMPQRYIFILQ